jgi:hypothetical protein
MPIFTTVDEPLGDFLRRSAKCWISGGSGRQMLGQATEFPAAFFRDPKDPVRLSREAAPSTAKRSTWASRGLAGLESCANFIRRLFATKGLS